MFLSIGNDMAVRDRSIIGIFDLDNTSTSKRTREFLNRAEREGEKPCCCITASTRSRVRSLTPLSLLRTRDTVDFPTPLKRAISLMVSRFCMRNSRQGW